MAREHELPFALIGLAGLLIMGYPLLWALLGITDAAQNESVRCEIGYNPVTHMCSDRVPSKCSGWSPPGFCWRRAQPQTREPTA